MANKRREKRAAEGGRQERRKGQRQPERTPEKLKVVNDTLRKANGMFDTAV